MTAKRVSFTVPLVPPSVNHYVKHTRSGRHYVTAEAKAFKSAVSIFAAKHRGSQDSSECLVEINVYLGRGARGDVDNFAKVCLDGLVEAGVLRSDSEVQKLTLAKFRDWQNPRTEFVVTECEAQ
jgi:crossover junction endodeoxyribonuclease RusA